MKRIGQVYRDKLKDNLRQAVTDSQNVFLLSYTRLSAPKISDLRRTLKKAGAQIFVSKNSLARIALKDLKHDALAERITGQTAFVWSNKDSADISKILVKFAKECVTAKLTGGLISAQIIAESDIKRLSELPSREVLLSQLLATIQAPLTRLAYVLNAKSIDVLSILKQLSEKKGGS